jgi:cytochrome c oxidase subunit 1
MLALAFSFVMLGFGGAGGIINMSYQLDSTIHNTQWITGHFHLIFGGAVVIMYFVIAYDLWPQLTGRALGSLRLIHAQLWLWFLGMMTLTIPWHVAGLYGMPRRMAYYDYSSAALAPDAWTVIASVIGGALLVTSGCLFIYILAASHFGTVAKENAYRFSEALHDTVRVPPALNGFRIWFTLMVALTLVNYGFPIWQLARLKHSSVPAIYVGGRQ